MKELDLIEEVAKECFADSKNIMTLNVSYVLAIADAFRALEQRAEAAEALAAETALKCVAYASANVENLSRAEAAEAKLKDVTESRDQWRANAHEFSRCADRLEAKLAELDKQDPVAYFVRREHEPVNTGTKIDADKKDAFPWPDCVYQPLYTSPAPAVSMEELVPAKKSTDIDYAYYPLSKARREGYNECVDDILRNIKETK